MTSLTPNAVDRKQPLPPIGNGSQQRVNNNNNNNNDDDDSYRRKSSRLPAAKRTGSRRGCLYRPSACEHKLLAEIAEKFATRPWIRTDRDRPNAATMPPSHGGLPKPKHRPSSASANLQSHPSYTSGLYDLFEGRPRNGVDAAAGGSKRGSMDSGSTAGVPPLRAGLRPRPKTTQTGPRYWGRSRTAAQPTVAEPRKTRRLTLTGAEPVSDADLENRRRLTQLSINNDLKGKIEERISIDILEELKEAFGLADSDGSGKLEYDEFKTVLKMELNLPASKEMQIEALFQKIDCTSQGGITWDEFCTYMQLEYAEIEDSYRRSRQVGFQLPAKSKPMPHREPVLRIIDTPPDGSFVACSQDGLITFWSSNMSLRRAKSIITKKEYSSKRPAEMASQRAKSKWITDFLIMSHYNKIVIGTGDREIQFYELSSFEPYCQISSLETVPLKLDYSYVGHDECLILYGDSQGCVNVLVIQSAGECLRTWKKSPKADGIASIGLDQIVNGTKVQFLRWKVHGDWVQQLKYYHDIRQIVSCSNHENTALVIGCTTGSTLVDQQLKENRDILATNDRSRPKLPATWAAAKQRSATDQSVFRIYKGVKCFDYSKKQNVIATGGMDRLVRIWNPYVTNKPTGLLRGHAAPICYVYIASDENRLYSVSTDRCVRVWDIQDQNCLLTLRPKSHRIRGDIQSCHYSNLSKTLAIATDQMNGLSLKLRSIEHADVPVTHKEPIHAVVYNPIFKQVITCSDGSVIKLWDFETGSEIFEFGEAHGDSAITCMTLDNTKRRLISGGRDGSVRIWNYNNGHCLKTMKKEKNSNEICALSYVHINKNRYVVAVGWDKRVNIYVDSVDDLRQTQEPQQHWHDDMNNGHSDDIMSVAHCPPNLLATSSYDGEIIVWNMISGHLFCHLHSPVPAGYKENQLDSDITINKVLFLRTRSDHKDGASLVASGPYGYIHFWNVFNNGVLMAQFLGSKQPYAVLTAMETNDDNSLLFTADSFGFISVWNIVDYCMEQNEPRHPPLERTWRGHTENVTCMTFVDDLKILITSSLDCTVRLWTQNGEYIGTLGQPDPWDIYNRESYQHPMVPYDVLVDPLSLPSHPVIREHENTREVVFEDCDGDVLSDSSECDEMRESTKNMATINQSQNLPGFLSDEAIAELLRNRPFSNGTGKRLRHERMKPVRVDHGGPNEYQMLRCYDLETTPPVESPRHLHRNRDDPFDNFISDAGPTE